MRNKVEHRCRILEMVDRNHITLKEAASLVSLSYRHLRRLYKRYKDNGESGLVHGLQGKKSNRKIKKNLRKKILSCYKKDYQHYGPTFTAQKLTHLGYAISRETLRRWLIDEGLWRQNEKHIYQRFNKKVQKNFGERIWLFVHEHTWLGKTYNNLYLFCLMDEATSITLSLISEKNTTRAAMKILWMWVEKYGILMSLCCESKYVYAKDRENEAWQDENGIKPKTGFYDVCEILGIETIITSLSQAPRSLKYNFLLYINKLLPQLQTKSIYTISKANRFMNNGFLKKFNRLFAYKHSNLDDFHVQLGENDNLHNIICFHTKKRISGQRTFTYKNRHFSVCDDNNVLPPPHAEVTVKEWLDGSVHVFYGRVEVAIEEILY